MLIFFKLADKGAQSTLFYCPTQTRHQGLIVVQIVNRIELRSKHLAAFVEMMQVGSAEILAGVAAAISVQSGGVVTVSTIA